MNRTIPSTRALPLALLACALALPACSSDDPEPTKEPAPAPEQTAADFFTCQDTDFSPSPFGGPGYDEAQGGLLGPAQDTYLTSVTLLQLEPEQAAADRFGELVGAIVATLGSQDGLIGYALGTSQQCGYASTITVWRDEEAMMRFVMSDAHAAAMSEATTISAVGVVVSFELPAAEVPISWEAARARVLKEKTSY